MRTALLALFILALATPAAAIDGAPEKGGDPDKSADFREMVVSEREKAREEYLAMVERRRQALVEAMTRDPGARTGRGGLDLDPAGNTGFGPSPSTLPLAGEEKESNLLFFVVAGVFLILGLRLWRPGWFHWSPLRRKKRAAPTRPRSGDEPMTLTLASRDKRYRGGRYREEDRSGTGVNRGITTSRRTGGM